MRAVTGEGQETSTITPTAWFRRGGGEGVRVLRREGGRENDADLRRKEGRREGRRDNKIVGEGGFHPLSLEFHQI